MPASCFAPYTCHRRLADGPSRRERWPLPHRLGAIVSMAGDRIPDGVLGSHRGLLRAIAAARRVGPTGRAVLIHGETGTGKERIARLVHETSGRHGEFVAVNCATLVDTLLESELFGHERGAFTGASVQKKGLFETADGGTLFLDEVGDLPLPLQAGLLRVLQERKLRRVGGTRDIPVNVRVVAASHRDLLAMTERNEFRLDLYHRLAEYRLTLPPLRERGRDVVTIARHLLAEDFARGRAVRLCRDAEDALAAYPWPGNVRELRNVISQVAIDAVSARVTAKQIRAALPGGGGPLAGAPDLSEAIIEFVRVHGQADGAAIRSGLHLSKSGAQRHLQRLIEDGVLAVAGSGRACRYLVASPAAPTQLDPREAAALAIAARNGRVTRRVLATEAGLAPRTAGRVLSGLVEAGRLVNDGGTGAAAGYVRPD